MAATPARTQDTTLYGSFAPGGFRVGAQPSTGRPGGAYGSGMPYASHFTYSFVPPAVSTGGIALEVDVTGAAGAWLPLNIAGVPNAKDVWPYVGAPYVPREDDGGTTPSQTQEGAPWGIQFQYPTTIDITLVDGVPDAGNMTIFGYDLYGQPIQALVDLPTIIGGSASTNSAFYGVVGIWYSGGNGEPDCTCNIQVGNLYGLPYVLKDTCHIINYSTSGVAPQTLSGLDYWLAGYFGTPTYSSSDVRGLVRMAPDADGVTRISFTYYVQGADPNQAVWNQIGSGVNPSGLPWNIDEEALPSIPSLTSLYGLVPYFTGTP